MPKDEPLLSDELENQRPETEENLNFNSVINVMARLQLIIGGNFCKREMPFKNPFTPDFH
jgi:hypothetical protein